MQMDPHVTIDQDKQFINWMLGFGCFAAWVSLMKYMENCEKLSLNINVIKFALPRLFMLLVEFTPLFISFMIIGMTSFYLSERFSSIRATIVRIILGITHAD